MGSERTCLVWTQGGQILEGLKPTCLLSNFPQCALLFDIEYRRRLAIAVSHNTQLTYQGMQKQSNSYKVSILTRTSSVWFNLPFTIKFILKY